jgi:acyl carrier protein
VNDRIRDHVADALFEVAPELEGTTIDPDADLQDTFDLDSMDFLNFVTGLTERLGTDIPERDYPHLRTLGGAVAYLEDATSGSVT